MERPRTTHAEPRRRTGGRSARVVNAVLDAAVDLLARSGFAALTFEDVAARAGVSRTTVYRRWPAKQDLVRAALLRLAEEQPVTADTGDLRGDLLAATRSRLQAHRPERDAGLVRALMAEIEDPELVALARVVRDRMLQPLVALVERAVARGELPAGTDPLLVLDPIFATLHLRIAMFRERVAPEFLERLVDVVLTGARAGAAVRADQR